MLGTQEVANIKKPFSDEITPVVRYVLELRSGGRSTNTIKYQFCPDWTETL